MPTPDQFIAEAIAALERAPDQPGPWHHLIECFIRFRRPAELLRLLELRQGASGDGISLMHDALVGLMYKGLLEPVAAFLATMPGNHLFLPQALFLSGWIAAARDDLDGMVRQTRLSLQLLPAIKAVVERDHRFVSVIYPKMLNQHDQIADRGTILSLADEEPPLPIRFDEPPGASPEIRRVILTAANGRYINAFAEDWLRELDRHGREGFLIHLHAIEADAETQALIARLKARAPHLRTSWQNEGVVGQPSVYFACARYLLAPQILDHYRRPIVTSDIDLGFHHPIAAAMDPARDLDIAWYETKEPPPSHRPNAALVHINDTPGSRRFLAPARALMGRGLRAGCHWMLDQTVLYCVSRGLAGAPDAPRWADLGRLTGAELKDFVAQCTMKFEEKSVLRGWVAA